jgi:diaminohydroxyphosphoribosylaminopyrimidine deaminase/5-amino-6-(5-phosphoribosylamino)uracil reductase
LVRGAEVVRVDGSADSIDLAEVMRYLSSQGLLSVLLEGGGELNWKILARGLVDYLYLFMSPRLVGGKGAVSPIGGEGFTAMSDAVPVYVESQRMMGQDLLVEARIGSQKRW